MMKKKSDSIRSQTAESEAKADAFSINLYL